MIRTALKALESIPQKDRYFARLFNKGLVTYYTEGPGGRPQAIPGDVLSYYDDVMRNGQFEGGLAANHEWDIPPEKRPIVEKLVSLGLYRKNEKSGADFGYGINPESAFKYRKSWPPSSEWKSPADVPTKTWSYGHDDYSSWTDTILVDTAAKTISLDASWTRYMNRRPGQKPGKGQSNSTYVIPSGDLAFAGNKNGLVKIVKHVLEKDRRVTSDFDIVGSERLFGKKVRDLLSEPLQSEIAVGNFPKGQNRDLFAFHGTTTKRWKEISTKGLRPGSRDEVYVDLIADYSNKNVYLTFDESEAENYATRASIWDGGAPLVLKVLVPDPAKFVTDEDQFAWIKFPKPVTLTWGDKATYNKGLSYEATEVHAREWIQSREKYVQDANFAAVDAIVDKYIRDQVVKSAKAGGAVAYRGIIPPRFIKKFREYPKRKFPSSEAKGVEFEEYQQTRHEVLDQMKRYESPSPARVASRFTRRRT